MLKRLLCGLAACCLLFALAPAGTKADTVRIDDLTDGIPTVQVLTAGGVDVTASRVTIQGDSAPEFLHFQILLPPGIGALPGADYTDLFEDFLGGTLSDRFLLVAPGGPIRGTPFLDVFLASDPAQLSNAGALNSGLNAVETGSFQLVLDFVDQYFVRSDAPRNEVPGPAALTLLGIGTLSLLGSRAWRRRKAIADATRPTSAGHV